MNLDLTDEEAAALTRHLLQALDYDPYPFAPRLDPLKSVLPKARPAKAATGTVAAGAGTCGAKGSVARNGGGEFDQFKA
jgi:hypothetical protein